MSGRFSFWGIAICCTDGKGARTHGSQWKKEAIVKVFKREMTETHCVGAEWPTFLGSVEIGESFVIETVGVAPNGPIEILGVEEREAIAVHIERIELEGTFYASDADPFSGGRTYEWGRLGKRVPLEYRNGYLYWPKRFRLRAQPSVGNVAVLPQPTEQILEACRFNTAGPGIGKKNAFGWRTVVRAYRDKHSHQDCWATTEGSIVHMKVQVDGAGLCMDDVHAYISQGEMGIEGIEAIARVQVRVERSQEWYVDWPIIETTDEIMVVCGYCQVDSHRSPRYVDLVRQAYQALRQVVAARVGSTIEEVNSLVAAAADLRNCALYGLGIDDSDISVVACLRKDVFLR